MIHQKNEERKEIVQSIYDEAKTMVDPSLSAQVLAKEGWNPGVPWYCRWSFLGRTSSAGRCFKYRGWTG